MNKKIKTKEIEHILLGHIARNTNNIPALNFLIDRVGKETDKYIVSFLLGRTAHLKKPNGTDLRPLIEATKSDKWLIRHSGIQSLNHSSDPIAETTLIEILENSDDPYNLAYANAVLSKIGTINSIPYLEKHLRSRKRDVKISAKYAIEEIIKRNG